MKLDSWIAIAILVVAVLGCTPSNQNTRRDRPPDSQSSPAPVEGRGDGPISESSRPVDDYGPNRNPAENADNYRLQQQGQAGPCNEKFIELYNAYYAWKNNTMPVERYREYENAYDGCVEYNYPSR